MKCTRTDFNGESRLHISGSLDALTVRDIKSVLDTLVADRPRRVSVDISELTLIDSSGIGAIVSLFKRMKEQGGQLVVVGARDQPLAVLKLLKLERIFGL